MEMPHVTHTHSRWCALYVRGTVTLRKMGKCILCKKTGRKNVVYVVSEELAFILPTCSSFASSPKRGIPFLYRSASKPHTGCFIRKKWKGNKPFDKTVLCWWEIALGYLSKSPGWTSVNLLKGPREAQALWTKNPLINKVRYYSFHSYYGRL